MPPRTGLGAAVAVEKEEKAAEWDVTPGGMVVQKRDPDSGPPPAVIPTIRVKVKHGLVHHEIYISSQATFGELKKMLSARIGMHPQDQKIMYKDKERDSAAFLDTAGVKDRSKLVLVEDATAKAKRLLEMRRTDKMAKAAKSIAAISREVDKLTSKVSALEAIVSKGGRVVEEDVIRLIELLMNELIKLDGIAADGDVKLERRAQVRRVQKYVETLDLIKIKNAMPKANGQINQQQQPQFQNHHQQQQQKRELQQQRQLHYQQHNQQQQKKELQQPPPPQQQQHYHHHQQQQQQQRQPPQPVVVTTNWETFDSLIMPSTSATTTTSTSTSTVSSTATTRFDWELF